MPPQDTNWHKSGKGVPYQNVLDPIYLDIDLGVYLAPVTGTHTLPFA